MLWALIDDTIAISIPTSCRMNNNRVSTPRDKWFDRDCSQARKKSFAWLKLVRKYPQNPFLKREYLSANKTLKALLKSKRQAYFENIAHDLSSCRNASQFWSKVRLINNDSQLPRPCLPIELKDLCEHFKNLTKDKFTTSFQFAIPFQADDALDAPLCILEVKAVLVELKCNKAPGSNGIPPEFYKFSTPSFIEHFTLALNQAFEDGCIPTYFKDSIVTPIFKKGDRTDPANYRGISLLNTSMKILTRLLYKRLYGWVQANHLLGESQAGFRKNYSTIDQIYSLTSIADIFIKDKKKLYAFFIDFKAAFDTIDRKALMLKLTTKVFQQSLDAFWKNFMNLQHLQSLSTTI
ncbi:uncharacterized protein LOC129951457 [Eupeodes corollae]|uniref:uncharacterized protein LOC129951457 n=1 Tax=Eupeodes corollae TaxID=290404 RepID=UPI002490FAAF|nr:uncharacterized protein LOC129951457 [Eupeodes corollae]